MCISELKIIEAVKNYSFYTSRLALNILMLVYASMIWDNAELRKMSPSYNLLHWERNSKIGISACSLQVAFVF